MTAPVLIDDRLLVEELLAGLDVADAELHTTTYWYYRACRAAVAGAGGHLSGPFTSLQPTEQEAAIRNLLLLPSTIGLPDPRATVPVMAELASHHPRLNLLNLEATAAAVVLDADVWLSPAASAGVLPAILDTEQIGWRTVALD